MWSIAGTAELDLAREVDAAESGDLRPVGEPDPALALEGAGQEAATWQQLAELDHEVAERHVERALTIARGHVLARAAGRSRPDVVGELMGTLSISRQAAEFELRDALLLAAHPRTVLALRRREIGLRAARALLGVLAGLGPDTADAVELAVLPKAAGRPPSRVTQMARREALRQDPYAAARRRKEAAQGRHIRLTDAGDGMVEVAILMRAEQGLAALQRAERATDADDGTGRTRDQRAADWATEQLLGLGTPQQAAAAEPAATPAATPAPAPAPHAVPGADLVLDPRRRRPVQALVHVPVTTGLGLDDEPCHLERVGPLDAEHGRLLLSTAELRKVCVDAATGEVLHVESDVVRPVADRARVEQLTGAGLLAEHAVAQAQAEAVRAALVAMVRSASVQPLVPEPQYRPSAALGRTVRARDLHCDFVGCGTDSARCDLEHTVAHPRGPTVATNLAPRSRWCHRRKQSGWRPLPLPDGSTLWRSPSGRVYTRPSDREPPPGVEPGGRLEPPAPPPPRDDEGTPYSPWTDPDLHLDDQLEIGLAWGRALAGAQAEPDPGPQAPVRRFPDVAPF